MSLLIIHPEIVVQDSLEEQKYAFQVQYTCALFESTLQYR